MAVAWPQPEFSQPEWLWLLLSLPLFVVYFCRSLVDLPRRQMIASLSVRMVMATMLILALAELTLRERSHEVFVVFAVDQSLSVNPEAGHAAAHEFIEKATRNIDEHSFAILPFSAQPDTFCDLADLSATRDESTGTDHSSHPGTDLQTAIDVASAVVPAGHIPHVVLLTDGNETRGNLASAADVIRISTIPLPVRSDPEIQVTAVNVPSQVAEGEPFRIEVIVDSNHADKAIVDVFSGDFRIVSEVKEISSGENTFVFTEQVTQPTEFSARIRSAASADGSPAWKDSLLDNNLASGLVFTTGKPRVLLVEAVPELAKHIEWAMEEEGIAIETRPPQGMPESLTELQNFEVLMLSNVPATDLSETQMDVIRRYVSDLGGGFVMLGGEDSFGLGGYYKTVVEDVLPVRCDFEKEKEKPGLGMVIVMDKSGSMGGQKIQLAKEAAAGAVELLSEKDQIGVIAFDGTPYWISEVRPCSQKGIVMDRIASIEPGGGTTLYPAMEEAFNALSATNARLKHVIILTDGYSTPGDFESITQKMVAARITVSTVGIGDADQAMLEKIAQQGEGRYYFSDDASSIPQIFARETITASKSAIKEEPFLPIMVRATPVLQDVNFDEAPFLLGHVVTRPKATSEVILTTETGDPLLSWWRYGLGMSVAFTSDAKSQWAAEWLTWNGFNRFWAQVIRHAMRKTDTKGFTVDLRRMGDVTNVVIDSVDADGQFLNEAETELTLIGPQTKSENVPVRQTAPGRYEATLSALVPGAWHLQITQKVNGRTVYQQSRGLVVGYSDEFRLRPVNEELLKAVAASSGGTFEPNPEDVFRPQQDEVAFRITSLWQWLLLGAMILFVVDVALRRLEFQQLFGADTHRSDVRGRL